MTPEEEKKENEPQTEVEKAAFKAAKTGDLTEWLRLRGNKLKVKRQGCQQMIA